MSSTKAVHSRVIRRETHSPRSGLAIALAVIIIIVSAWLGTETVIAMLGKPALLAAPVDMARSIVDVARYSNALVIIGGIIVAIVGLILVIGALTSGRRARRTLPSDRSAVVVDDEVIASALARQASYAGNVDPDNVEVSVSRRTAVVRVRPSSGQAVDTVVIQEAVATTLEKFEVTPRLKARVAVSGEAKVGA